MSELQNTPFEFQNTNENMLFFEKIRKLLAGATTAALGLVKQAAAVADLNQTVTNPPTQAEVQDISDKVDELLAKLRTSGALDT